MTAPDPQKKSFLYPMIGFAALLISLAIVLFTGAASINRSNIEQRLLQVSEHISRQAAEMGKESKLTYGKIEIGGWGYNKSAVVDNVSLEVSEKTVLDTNRWTLSTLKMLVLPDPTMVNTLFFVFPDPINVIENSQLKTVVNFSEPLKYGYFDGYENKKHTITHVLHLPNQISFLPVKTADDSADKQGALIIAYDDHPVFRMRSVPDDDEHEAVYEFHNVRVSDDEGAEASIGVLSSRFSAKRGAGKRMEGKYTLMVNDLVLRDNDKRTAPYAFSADIDFSGDQPFMKLRDPAAGAGSADITVNALQLSRQDFKIKADGKLSLASDDPLPSGALSIDIDNVQPFLSSELVPEAGRKTVAAALQKVTGQPSDLMTHVVIPLKREKNGVLYIGNITFEELAASMLAEALKMPSQAAAPVLPPPTGSEPPAPQKQPDAPIAPAPAPDAPPANAAPGDAPAKETPAKEAPVADTPAKGAM